MDIEVAGPLAVGVLAGERLEPSELIQAEGVGLKALIDIAGRPMLARVLDVVAEAAPDAACLLVGPNEEHMATIPGLTAAISAGRVVPVASRPSPSLSAGALVEAGSALGATAIAVTTGDHPLLTVATFKRFLTDALAIDADVVIGLVDQAAVQDAFPASRRTTLRFMDGNRCGCNLFLFRSPGALRVLEFWQQLEQERKRPDRILRRLGAGLAVRYLTGHLALKTALDRLGELTDAHVVAVPVYDPDAAVDVDSLDDLATVRARWAQREAQAMEGRKS